MGTASPGSQLFRDNGVHKQRFPLHRLTSVSSQQSLHPSPAVAIYIMLQAPASLQTLGKSGGCSAILFNSSQHLTQRRMLYPRHSGCCFRLSGPCPHLDRKTTDGHPRLAAFPRHCAGPRRLDDAGAALSLMLPLMTLWRVESDSRT